MSARTISVNISFFAAMVTFPLPGDGFLIPVQEASGVTNMIIATIHRGAAAALFIVLCAGAASAVTQPPPRDWGREALGLRGPTPGPARDAQFIAQTIKGPKNGGRAEAPLPGLGRPASRDEPKRHDAPPPPPRHERRERDGRGDGIVLAPPAASVAATVPIPAAAPLLFAALGALALLRRRTGPKHESGASEA